MMNSAIALKKDEQREFYKSYVNLCTLKQLPMQSIRKTETHLDIPGDHIPMDEWGPILISLERDLSLCAISVRARPFTQILAMDIEEQIREYCTRPILQTRFIMMNLMKALTSCLEYNDRLQCLTLDGLLLTEDYIAFLNHGVAKSKSLQMLALRRCGIRDVGLASLCVAIRDSSNIVALDLTQNDITDKGTMVLSELIAHQRRLRASAGWTPEGGYGAESFMGIRRVTLNHNPGIGDKGVARLAASLATNEEIWMKALDLQDCGLTDLAAIRFLELLDDKRSELELVDIRANDVSPCLVREIQSGAGGTADFPLLAQVKRLTVRPVWTESVEHDADCFNSSAINLRHRTSSAIVVKPGVERRTSRPNLAFKPSAYPLSTPSTSNTAVCQNVLMTSSRTGGAIEDAFHLDLRDLDQMSDSSANSERTILKGLDDMPFNLTAPELKQKEKEITEAIKATRKRRLEAEKAVKKAEDEMREMLKTMEGERLLKEDAMRRREAMTGIIMESDNEDMRDLGRREMGRMVGDSAFMNFRRLKSEGDLAPTTDVAPSARDLLSTNRSSPHEIVSKKTYHEVSSLLERFETDALLSSKDYSSSTEPQRPQAANREEQRARKRHDVLDRCGDRNKPRPTPSEIFEQLTSRTDGGSSGSGQSVTSEWTYDEHLSMQSAPERIAAMLRETPSIMVQEIDDASSKHDF